MGSTVTITPDAPQVIITPDSSNVVKVGGQPLNLITGEGTSTYDPTTQNQMEQAHGAVSLMGRPAASIAAEKSFEDAATSPTPTIATAPEGSKAMAEAGADIPILASSAAAVPAAGIALESLAGKIASALPSSKMAAAGRIFQELKGSMGGHTVPVTNELADSLADIKQAVDTGSTLPSVINKFVTRIADTDQGPLTYTEARQFYHNVSELSASEKMATKPSDLRLIQSFKHALGDSIANTADAAGNLEKYQAAMKGFAKGAQQQQTLSKAKDLAIKTAVGSVVGAGTLAGARKLWDLLGH